MKFDAERTERFLSLLPQTPKALIEIAEKAVSERRTLVADATGIETVRHAIEVRNTSFADPAFVALLRNYNVALVTADTAEWPAMDTTADFAYLRLQGAPGSDHYEDADLDRWANRLKALWEGRPIPDGKFIGDGATDGKPRDVFAYFVSTDKVHAPANAMATMKRLGIRPPE